MFTSQSLFVYPTKYLCGMWSVNFVSITKNASLYVTKFFCGGYKAFFVFVTNYFGKC